MIYFVRDQPLGYSSAEQEWDVLDNRFPREMSRLETHLRRVEAAASTTSWPVRQAQHINPGPPNNLYWWEDQGVGAFYLYDGTDLAILKVGVVSNPPYWSDLCDEARQRA